MSTGGRRADRRSRDRTSLPVPYLVAMGLGAALAAIAWVYLVRAAIDFGHLARDGQANAWVFSGAATLGAAVCALLVLVLIARGLRALGLISDYRPRRAAGRRRGK